MNFKHLLLFIFFYSITLFSSAQSAIGDWKNHSPFTQLFAVTEGNGKIYAANKSSVFAYVKSDNSIERIDKTNFLTQTSITAIKYNTAVNALIVGYENGNIDIIKNDQKINYPFIKTSSIIGDKKINKIYVKDEFAYLCTGFGIVKLDVAKVESPDTYVIGPAGSQIRVNDVTIDDFYIYAATEMGIYKALLTSPILGSYQAWSIDNSLPNPNGNFGSIKNVGGIIFATFNDAILDDVLYKKNGELWDVINVRISIYSIESSGQHLVLCDYQAVLNFDQNGAILNTLYSNGDKLLNPLNAIEDPSGFFWVADSFYGLAKLYTNGTTELIKPNGPEKTANFKMAFGGKRLVVATGVLARPGAWNNGYTTNGIYTYNDQQWQNSTRDEGYSVYFDSLSFDFASIAIDPKNSDHYFVGSWGSGLYEMSGLDKIKIYNTSNSSLQFFSGSNVVKNIGGLCFDDENNLWVTNSVAPRPLSVKKVNGDWKSFNLANIFGATAPFVREIINTTINQKWLLLGNGIAVYDNNQTIDDESDDKAIKFSSGEKGLPTSDVGAIAEDQDGEIWVGTSQGIVVFYSPSDLFSDNPSDAQDVYIDQDGDVQLLLENENISAIAIDGANRKWIGTFNSGVYLMSQDGTQQVQHFTSDNSPLLSNVVYDIAIDQSTGEIYFGTENGIISYKGDAIKGELENNCANVFPNPVRPNFYGSVAFSGLQKDATVKITDVAGNLIYETKSLGGQAIWSAKNFNGDRVATGVYLAICSDSEGESTCVSKVLVAK